MYVHEHLLAIIVDSRILEQRGYPCVSFIMASTQCSVDKVDRMGILAVGVKMNNEFSRVYLGLPLRVRESFFGVHNTDVS